MMQYSNYFKSCSSSDFPYEVIELGKLYLPSGKIYCCDPFLSDEVNPFEIHAPIGSFNVKLSVAKVPGLGNRVTLAGLFFSENMPVKWQAAMYIKDGESSSDFRVDAGLSCFMDKETRDLFVSVVDDFYEENPDANYYDDILAADFKQNAYPKNSEHAGDWAIHYPLKDDPRNITMFASGLGDGLYSASWGFDEYDQIVMLVIDFKIL
jgi:Protein of unknown function (DUF4241)